MCDKNSSTLGPCVTEVAGPSARAHLAGYGVAADSGQKDFWARRKLAFVQRLLRGESLDL